MAHRFVASPNHGERHKAIDTLILHYTGMATGQAALERLCDPAAEVSCHYLVWENGAIDQLVLETRRAWHAGKSSWAGHHDLNSASIGIEIVNIGHTEVNGQTLPPPPYPADQISAVIALCQDIATRHSIPKRNVLAHSDIAPGRKVDPGEHFPWPALAAQGVGHWVQPAPLVDGVAMSKGTLGPPVMALQHMLHAYGYGVEVNGTYDAKLEATVAAFQRHFRPARVDGVADRSTLETLRALIAGL